MTCFKLLTSDFRPPVQGGEVVWDGTTLPVQLPTVKLDTSAAECSFGWNYVEDLAEGFKVARLWPTGRPNVVLVVTPSKDAISRGAKHRASSLRFDRLATTDEIAEGIRGLSKPLAPHVDRMVSEQVAWRTALSRPGHDAARVESALAAALTARGLGDWTLTSFGAARAARAARDAWDARAARDAWDARDALSVCFASLQGWVKHDPMLLTTGIREAYANGLEVALPTGPKTLGYAMAGVEAQQRR